MKKKTITIPLILIVIIIILLVVVGVLAVNLYKKNDNNEQKQENNKVTETPATAEENNKEEKIETRDLTLEELQEIANYLGNGKKLFLATEYEKPEDAKLYFQIHYGMDEELEKQTMTKEEMEEAQIDTEILETTTISKITEQNMEKYIKDNLDISMQEWKAQSKSGIDYSDILHVYYYYEPTDAYPLNINIVGGKIDEEGLYVLNYTDSYKYDWTLTLAKDGDKYIFVSNINSVREKIKDIEKMQDLKEIEVEYNRNMKFIMHYKDGVLYFVESVDDTDSVNMYYYDNDVCFATINYYNSDIEEYGDCSFGNERVYQVFKSNKTSLK